MNYIRAFALFTASLFLALSVMTSAHAALIHNLTTSFGSGQITFTNDLGGTDVNDVEAFFFDVTSGQTGGPQSYGLSDIDTIDWSIASDWALTLNLVSVLLPLGMSQTAIMLINDGVPRPSPCIPSVLRETSSCELFPFGGSALFNATLTTSAVHGVPEPPTTLMFAVGLVSLIWLRRRRFSLCRRRFLGDFV